MTTEAQIFKKNWQSTQKSLRESGEDCAFVYVHLEADTGNPFYVGIGQKHGRPWSMNHHSRKDFHRNIVNKHGVHVQIVADNLTWEAAKFWEVRWIKSLRDSGCRLVNLTDGGDGTVGFKNPNGGYWVGKSGPCHPAYKRPQKESTRQLLRHINTGKTHSEKTKQICSEKSSGENNYMFGRKHSDEVVSAARQRAIDEKNDPVYCAKHKAGIKARWEKPEAVMARILISWERSCKYNRKNPYWGA